MYEGEQQVPREPQASPKPAPPLSEAKPVTAVPVLNEPLNGMEVTRVAPAQPPAPIGKEPVNKSSENRTPANDQQQQQFEWRREQPQHPTDVGGRDVVQRAPHGPGADDRPGGDGVFDVGLRRRAQP